MKQVIALRSDIDMSDGKKIAQACHASLGAYRTATDSHANQWEADGSKKAVVTAEKEELEQRFKEAQSQNIPAFLVTDAGETELEPGTVTALGIGPADDQTVDSITGDLSLL
ncbi:MAG: peptidyl-tRNA hydrolase Pth2 [Candidatus Nanohaloarchaea archaeon]|nr:peptidyl-tRNA hydrolase Pth2 [Candidatus Nanohaloarchaea archaeon]